MSEKIELENSILLSQIWLFILINLSKILSKIGSLEIDPQNKNSKEDAFLIKNCIDIKCLIDRTRTFMRFWTIFLNRFRSEFLIENLTLHNIFDFVLVKKTNIHNNFVKNLAV